VKYWVVYRSLAQANGVGRIKNSWLGLVPSMAFFGFSGRMGAYEA